jgi:hypothetical protein
VTTSHQEVAFIEASLDTVQCAELVDPSSHNTDPPGVFGGPYLEWLTEDAARNAEALDAVSHFIEQHGQMPTQDSWTAAGMSPCERTVRARFGSFRAAAEAAGLTVHP